MKEVKLSKDLKKAIQSIDHVLETTIESNFIRLKRAIKHLENKIINLSARLKVDDKGRIMGPRFAMKQAIDIRQEMAMAMEEIYNVSVQEQIRGYSQIETFVKGYFKGLGFSTQLNPTNKLVLKVLKSDQLRIFKELGVRAENQLAQALFDSVVGGSPFSSLVRRVEEILSGKKSKKGVPLLSRAEQFSQDAVMKFYATVQRESAKKTGLKYFFYSGNIVGGTRPFCADRVGRVFSKEEVDSWDSTSWKGQAGSVWVDRGGYRCRHHFVPVRKEWV